jgi:hypothetical protein
MDGQPIRIEALEDEDKMTVRFHESVECLRLAMDLTVRNPFADVYNVEILEIELRSNIAILYYAFDAHMHSTCDDYSENQTIEGRWIAGVLESGFWVFLPYKAQEPRSTLEEF